MQYNGAEIMHRKMGVFQVSVNSAGHRRVSLSKKSLASLILAARYGDPPAHKQNFSLILHLLLLHSTTTSFSMSEVVEGYAMLCQIYKVFFTCTRDQNMIQDSFFFFLK